MSAKNVWDNSYKQKDNYVFYPHEEIIRFVSKYIKKRIGFDDFINISKDIESVDVLDIGCGIGRHIKMLYEYKINGYGFDLSSVAINKANKLLNKYGYKTQGKLVATSILNLPYKDDKFMFAFSHGVLDSMPFYVARDGMKELYRIMKHNSFMYFDTISTEDHTFNGKMERIVNGDFEKDTVQSYFNINRINELIKDYFEIVEIYQIKKEYPDFSVARWHVIVKKY